jgi:alkanesulfonate monooxygenase SsuD/methylene tetrahydromethanopterin reductase-like flavin-dependent oxidoreductase (luciferase family)
MPARNVVPKPVQKPHPPLWVAASRRETTMVAARLGMGSLGFGFETPEELGERALEYYRLVREELMPIGHAINPALAVLNTFMMADTDEEAMRRSANGPAFFSYSLGYYYNPAVGGNHKPGGSNVYRDFLGRSGETATMQAQRGGFLSPAEIASGEPEDEIQKALYRAARSGNAIGTVESLRKTLLKYEAQHLDVMIFVAQCGDRKHEDIMESIETFGKNLLPEFRERHEREHRAWRADQLKGVDAVINSSV